MFYTTEHVVSLARANIANSAELSRVPLQCWKLSAQAAAAWQAHNLERWKALTSAEDMHELVASSFAGGGGPLTEKVFTYWLDVCEEICQAYIEKFNNGFSAGGSPEKGQVATKKSPSRLIPEQRVKRRERHLS